MRIWVDADACPKVVKEVKHQLLTWSMPTTVAWATSLVAILVADIFM